MTGPLRVCLVSSAYRPYPSGVSEHVYHLALELLRRGHAVNVLTGNYSDQGRDDLPVTRLGRVFVLPSNHSRFTLPLGLRLAGQVRDFLAAQRFDIIHCHGLFWPEISYWAIRYATCPAVVTFHSLRGRPPAFLAAFVRRAFPALRTKVSARIAVSEAGRAWAESWLPGAYYVIPNGVDTTRFTPGASRPRILAGHRQSVLYVGRLDRRKGIGVLIRAFVQVIARFPDVLLVVVGSGPLDGPARQLCIRLGISRSVHFAGPVSNATLPGYYAGCTVYCSPAIGGEAMGIVLIEAMAAGRPVVASDIPGYNEVVTREQDGLLVPPNNPAALATALCRVLGSSGLERSMSSRALARAAEFSWPTVTDRIEQVYRGLM